MKPALPIAKVGEGEMAACDVDGVKVLVCQVEGRFYALHNQCSHARQALHTGALVRHQIRCPLHGGRFDARTGACAGPPATLPIKTFPLMLENGKVHVDVSGMQERPRPRFGPLV